MAQELARPKFHKQRKREIRANRRKIAPEWPNSSPDPTFHVCAVCDSWKSTKMEKNHFLKTVLLNERFICCELFAVPMLVCLVQKEY